MFYPVDGEPGDVRVSRVQRSGHGRVRVHQLASQTSPRTGVDTRPGDGGSIQLETLQQINTVRTSSKDSLSFTPFESLNIADLVTINYTAGRHVPSEVWRVSHS